ncbi:MAG: hypothetical protein U0790_00260 [Isosphaeraceae bacterium]
MTPHHDPSGAPEDRDQRERLERLAARILGHRWDPPATAPRPCLDCGHPIRDRAGGLPLCEPCFSHRALQARMRAEIAAIFGPDDPGSDPESEGQE